jgi:hypothetical protein
MIRFYKLQHSIALLLIFGTCKLLCLRMCLSAMITMTKIEAPIKSPPVSLSHGSQLLWCGGPFGVAGAH